MIHLVIILSKCNFYRKIQVDLGGESKMVTNDNGFIISAA